MCQKHFRPIYLPLPKLPFHFLKQHWSCCPSRWVENWSLIQRHSPFQASPLRRARASRGSNLAASRVLFVPREKPLKRNQFLRKWPRWLGEIASLALCSSWEVATRWEEGGGGSQLGGGKWVRVTAHPPRRQDQVWDADPLHKQPLSHFSLYLIKGMGTRIKWPKSGKRFFL